MITPQQVKIIETITDYELIEQKIDDKLSKPWRSGEGRIIQVPEIEEMVSRYSKIGWNCRTYGYQSVIFYAPSPKKDKPWWKFW